MPASRALNFDHVSPALGDRLGSVVCAFPESRWHGARRALLKARGFTTDLP